MQILKWKFWTLLQKLILNQVLVLSEHYLQQNLCYQSLLKVLSPLKVLY